MPSRIEYVTMYERLRDVSLNAPSSTALVFDGICYEYNFLYDRVRQATAYLWHNLKLRKGSRVVLAWGNTPEFCELFFAALALGVVVIPFCTKLKREEGLALANRIEADVVFYDADVQDWLVDSLAVRHIALGEWRRTELPSAENGEVVEVAPDDPAVIMFTSGTTGLPKGAVITHRNLMSAVTAYADVLGLTAQDKTILAVPIYHITGLSALLCFFVHVGGTIHLHRKFSAPDVLAAIRDHGITFLHGSPTVFILLCQAAGKAALGAFPSLRSIACGAGHLNEGVISELTQFFPHAAIHTIYGLTETTSPGTIFRGDVRGSDKLGSSGQPVPGLAVAIRDDSGRDLPAGQAGAIWLKGDMVINGYWQNPEAQSQCFSDGWFHTGDIGFLDAERYLFIRDRSKDMINRGGEKIYSIEIENLVSTIPGVIEVAVVPTPSALYGEEPLALIVAEEPRTVSAEDILAFLRPRIAHYKLPVRLVFVRGFPRTHNDKLNKAKIKQNLTEYLASYGIAE